MNAASMPFPPFATPQVKRAVRQWRRHLAGRWAGPGLAGAQLVIVAAHERGTYLEDKAKLRRASKGKDYDLASSALTALRALCQAEVVKTRPKPWRDR